MNPTFIHNASRFTGVGWWYISGNPSASDVQLTAISPRHIISVRHLSGNFTGGNQSVRFLGSDNQVQTRTILPFTNILNGTDVVDLSVAELSSPLPATVVPIRYCNNQTEVQLTGDTIMVLGKHGTTGTSACGGKGVIAGFTDLSYTPYSSNTRMFHFDYVTGPGVVDDCYYGPSSGDSSSPIFVEYNSQPALVGVATVVSNPSPLVYQSYCTSVQSYIGQLDAILNPAGYRMRPAQYTATALSLASSAAAGTARQGHPASFTFTLGNTGGQTTGSVALTLAFNPAEAPNSVSAPGWVVEPMGGGVWSVRKAVMSAGNSIVATANWASLPAVASLGVNVTVESDTTSTTSSTSSFTVLPSYAAWAAGLSEAGEGDDPDDDGMENLLEYAFGGNAENGTMALPAGHPLRPVLSVAGGNVTLTYPERSDAGVRGLSYLVETATSPASLPGATTLPAGAVSSTAAYVPAEVGFVKRTITWPSDGPRRHARVKVVLAE
ncbi:hypothetical protein [Luteolibacter soli]|uniref:Uncharacterized protein n=1 Tax=Luteolibacter soli TaxID=3135280 RepID=A0ABU9B0N0_9BACT